MARPSDKQLDAAISRATLELLGEIGFDALTISGVATRAGTTRTAVYRRWPDKAALALAAVRHSFASSAGVLHIDTGSLRSDLLAHARILASQVTGQAAVLAGLLTLIRDNGELGELVRSAIVERDRQIMDVLIERGVRRGELRAAPVDELVVAVPVSMMFAQILLFGGTLDEDFLTRLLDHVVVPLYRAGPA
jgi:AcrR family transcriptional regulator